MSDSSRSWSPFAALGLSVAVLVGVPWACKLFAAPELGEPCGGGFDCAALDGRCVQGGSGSYCTHTCEGDHDCPASGHCGVPPHDPWQRWFASSVLSERFCVPGERPELPLDHPALMPGTEVGAQFRPPEQQGDSLLD